MVTFDRVQASNQVIISGVRYKLKSPVRFSLSTYPERQVTGTGEITADSDPTKSVHTWNDFSGGLGIDRMLLGRHDRRSRFSTAATDIPNHMILPPLATLTAGDHIAGDPLIGELNGNVVAAFGTSVESYNLGGDAWTERFTSGQGSGPLAGTPTDVVNLTLSTTEFLLFPYTTGYAYSSAVATWATSTKNVVKVAYWDSRLWGIDATGQLWFTFTIGSAEQDNAQLVLSHNDVITGLFTARDPEDNVILYCSTERFLYAHDFDNCQWVRQEVKIAPEGLTATNHERKATNFQDQMYLGSGSGTINYNTGDGVRVRDMGFDDDDGLPAASYEQTVFCMAESVRELLVGGKPLTSNDTALILAWNTVGWRVLWEATSANEEIVSMHVGYFGLYRVFFGFNNRVYYLRLNPTNKNPKQITGWTYTASTVVHKTPWFDAGQHEIDLTGAELIVESEDCTSTETLKIEYATDYTEGASDASYTDLTSGGTIQTDVRTVLTFPNNAQGGNANVGVAFRSIRFKVSLVRGSTTTLSPDMIMLQLLYRKKLRPKWLNTYDIDLTDRQFGTEKEQRATLVTAIETITFVAVTHRDDDGNTRNFYADIVAPTGEEQSGRDESGIITVTAIEQLSGA